MLQANITVSNNADWVQAFQWIDTGILLPTLQAGGTGFTSPPSVICSPPLDASGNLVVFGRPALVTATVSGGAVTGFTMVDPGEGYVAGYPPTISFVGAGSGAQAFTTVGNPITLVGSTLTLEVRPTAASTQLLGIANCTITDAVNGKFQIVIPKSLCQLLVPGQFYVHDLLRLRADSLTERMWTGTISVDGGVTR